MSLLTMQGSYGNQKQHVQVLFDFERDVYQSARVLVFIHRHGNLALFPQSLTYFIEHVIRYLFQLRDVIVSRLQGT